MAIPGPESRLPFIAFFYPYLVVGISQVQLGEAFGSTQTVQGVDSDGESMSILK